METCKDCIKLKYDLKVAQGTNKEFQDIIKAKDKWIDKLLKACDFLATVYGEEDLPDFIKEAVDYPDYEGKEAKEGWELL